MDNLIKHELCNAYKIFANSKKSEMQNCPDWVVISAMCADGHTLAVKKKSAAIDAMVADDVLLLDQAAFGEEMKAGNLNENYLVHQELYRTYSYIRGVVSIDSRWCSIWSSLGVPLPPLSTLHARCFFGEIPCTRPITKEYPTGGGGIALLEKLFLKRWETESPAKCRLYLFVIWGRLHGAVLLMKR